MYIIVIRDEGRYSHSDFRKIKAHLVFFPIFLNNYVYILR